MNSIVWLFLDLPLLCICSELRDNCYSHAVKMFAIATMNVFYHVYPEFRSFLQLFPSGNTENRVIIYY